ncbi:MAG: arsenic resistance N-acetyltransferase ArsN2 [Gemmatimonadales bacterium]
MAMPPEISIEPAREGDREAVLALLGDAGLPADGLSDHWSTVLVARSAGTVLGCAAVELYEDGALLRSVAVSPARRGEGVGLALSHAALELAREKGARDVYLLTESAEGFFPRLGFRGVERDQVPPGVRRSLEFTTLCPDSARAMALSLKG